MPRVHGLLVSKVPVMFSQEMRRLSKAFRKQVEMDPEKGMGRACTDHEDMIKAWIKEQKALPDPDPPDSAWKHTAEQIADRKIDSYHDRLDKVDSCATVVEEFKYYPDFDINYPDLFSFTYFDLGMPPTYWTDACQVPGMSLPEASSP